MAIERFYNRVGPVLFTQNGQADGIITVSDTGGFKVKMGVYVKADILGEARFEVKRVLSKTQLILGPESTNLETRSDLSAYVLALNPSLVAPFQARPKIPPLDFERAVYEEEPTVAKRAFLVDKYGSAWDKDNPLPTASVIDFNRPDTHSFMSVEIPSPGTVVSINFPDRTKYYQIRVRDNIDVLKIGLSAGDIGSGNYWTSPFGAVYEPRELMDFPNGYKLYVTSKHKPNVKLEIFVFSES